MRRVSGTPKPAGDRGADVQAMPARGKPEELGLHRPPARPDVGLEVYRPRHFGQVLDLYERIFGPQWAGAFRARWRWSQEANLFPELTRRWVLVHGDGVVGFLATVPIPYRINGADLVAHTPCDFMVDPPFRFHGIRLMKEYFRTCEHCVTCDDIPDSVRLTQWLGATAAGRLFRYVKLLDARTLRDRKEPLLRGLGRFHWAINPGLNLGERFRLRKRAVGVSITAVDGFDSRFAPFLERLQIRRRALVRRDPDYLRWRYGPESPHADREIAVATTPNGVMAGYVVFRMVRRLQQSGHILDLQVAEPNDPEATRALVTHAARLLRERGAWTIRCHLFEEHGGPPSPALTQLGFRRRGGHFFLIKLGSPALQAAATSPAGWSFGYGDSEASHADC